jgi:hypothetical protein
MKNIIALIVSIILPVLSLNEITPKLCVNCKFFRSNYINGNSYGKCSLFPKTELEIDLVTGIKKDPKYQFCSIARDYEDLCGKEGKKYEEKKCKCYRIGTLQLPTRCKLENIKHQVENMKDQASK